jgi:hypothetical protein
MQSVIDLKLFIIITLHTVMYIVPVVDKSLFILKKEIKILIDK